MGKRPRRNYSTLVKAKVAIDAIKGEKTLAELHAVHANQIVDWKNQLLGRAGQRVRSGGRAPRRRLT